jgi:hypothetical protein
MNDRRLDDLKRFYSILAVLEQKSAAARKRLADCLKTLGDDIVRYDEVVCSIAWNPTFSNALTFAHKLLIGLSLLILWGF